MLISSFQNFSHCSKYYFSLRTFCTFWLEKGILRDMKKPLLTAFNLKLNVFVFYAFYFKVFYKFF